MARSLQCPAHSVVDEAKQPVEHHLNTQPSSVRYERLRIRRQP
jgi:hypothetical protein